ncbi:MAG: 9-O-acetylesterase [Calditrichaeota bacterium]|nr:MAG: 9-O-acetylesterase [Calditrichota bacterium]
MKISSIYAQIFRKNTTLSFLLLSLFFGCYPSPEPARNVAINPLFSDNMVLQQNQDIPVWGTAEPDGEVVVELLGQRKSTLVDSSGKWSVKLQPITAGGPHELLVSGENTTKLKNVMIGEVWICSGQSNMEMALAGNGKINNYKEEIANANYPNIRLIRAQRAKSTVPLDTINTTGWQECKPNTIPDFSAVAYFFGRHLYINLNVPIGLIHSSWGGTLAEAWTSAEALKTLPDFVDAVESLAADTVKFDEAMQIYEAAMKNRKQKIIENDVGFRAGKYIWNASQLDLSGWKNMQLPTIWEKAGHKNLDGVVWFRKTINIPKSMSGKDLTLHLGPINDNDITWFNGIKVGGLDGVNKLREYQIPGSIVKTGANVIAVRVFDMGNNGGLWGEAEQLKIVDKSGQKISLAGHWKYKIGFNLNTLSPEPKSPNDPNRTTLLYNAMLHPLIPFAIRGAIWYQGESNANRAYQYRTLFPTMIKDWRTKWNQGDFPFLFVQLANFMKIESEPAESAWAELREAQAMALELPNTGMAVAIDIGDAQDIHPKNKQDVGKRLALNALAKVYDKEIAFSGPIYKSMEKDGAKIRVQFSHTNGGLNSKGNTILKGFAIAGADKKFVWANAKINGDEVVVWNAKIKNPVAVRYAWASNPVCNLYNGAGLPASPFRTDAWEGITENNK